MKLKIFITPIFIVAMIAFAVWVLAPAYFDLKDATAELNAAQNKLADIQDKIVKAGVLNQELMASAEQKNILMEYLPDERGEEGIINYLNDVSFKEGVIVYDISLDQKKEKANIASSQDMISATGSPADMAESAAASTPVAEDINATFKLVGSYGKIKAVLAKLANLKRYNFISTVKISKTTANSAEDNPALDSLSAEVVAKFKYLEGIKVLANVNNSVFAKSKFDMTVINDIKQNKDTFVSKLDAGSAGRGNPFIP